uniref:GYF domain-containing protein n=1 Tax=Steinernema glaseri TaxID=37863 RepID=A0A1I7ZC33_9BILA
MTVNGADHDNGVQWFYQTNTGDEHGPFHAHDMKNWVDNGYFREDLLVKTQNDNQYHLLGEYTRVVGKCPFVTDVASFPDASSKPSVENGVSPDVYSTPKPEIMQMGGQRWMNVTAPMHLPNNHPSQSMMAPPPPGPMMYPANYVYAPPMLSPYQHHAAPYTMPPMMPSYQAPETREAATETISNGGRDAECQTDPIVLTTSEAARILSRLIGQEVRVSTEVNGAEDHPPGRH